MRRFLCSLVLALLLVWYCQTVVQGVWLVTWQWTATPGQNPPYYGLWTPIAVEPYMGW